MNFFNLNISEVKLEIGNFVKKLRTQNKISQEELAKKLNLSRLTIQNVENGKNFNIDTILLIFQYFDELQGFYDYLNSRKSDLDEIESIY